MAMLPAPVGTFSEGDHMISIALRNTCRLTLGVTTIVLSNTVFAQAGPAVSLPQLTMRGGTGFRSLLETSGMWLSVDRDAYVAVFAFSPSRLEAPFQLLSPIAPKESSRLSAGRIYHTTRILPQSVMWLAAGNSSTVIVAFVSGVRPNLAAFQKDGRWATELIVSDTSDIGTKQFVTAMARELYGDLPYREAFGTDVPYRVVVRQLNDELPLSRYSGYRTATDCLSNINQLSWSAAIDQASAATGMAPRTAAVGDAGCGGYGIDWPVAMPGSQAQTTPPGAGIPTTGPTKVVP